MTWRYRVPLYTFSWYAGIYHTKGGGILITTNKHSLDNSKLLIFYSSIFHSNNKQYLYTCVSLPWEELSLSSRLYGLYTTNQLLTITSVHFLNDVLIIVLLSRLNRILFGSLDVISHRLELGLCLLDYTTITIVVIILLCSFSCLTLGCLSWFESWKGSRIRRGMRNMLLKNKATISRYSHDWFLFCFTANATGS